ncbi:MAG: hypothetical protein AAB270_06585 [Chloroflexota bacterium]
MPAKLCSVCGQNEASVNCAVCSVPLCTTCLKEVRILAVSPGTTHKGVTTSTLRPAETIKKVCPKCMKEVDFL